jgi:hypothetical protein
MAGAAMVRARPLRVLREWPPLALRAWALTLESCVAVWAGADAVAAGSLAARRSACAERTSVVPPPVRRTNITTEAAATAVAANATRKRLFLPINMPSPARKSSP